ncbi:MAG: SNF1-interacting protein [Caeruleum heppii]|nr:MAG: SNF1-interacting protein [Caeruleum heppii]
MATSPEQPALQQIGKPLNLIPVGLKEAALDSPTFRATAVHFSDQIDVVERWLDGYVKATSKLIQEVSGLEDLINTFLSRSVPPPTISEAVFDHDYTLLAMKKYGEGAREFWSYTITGMKKMDSIVVEPIRAFLQGELRNFRDARKYLDATQKHHDTLLSRYAGQSKTKEASSLREDAFQLFEARKLYMKASFDFCVLAPQVRSTLDKILVKIFSDQWREMRRSREGITGDFGKAMNEMERIRSWSAEMEAGERTFRRELQNARRTLEEQASSACRPSRELEDYTTSNVPFLGSQGISTINLPSPVTTGLERSEKQGWLYLKTLAGKPTRTVWLRRWFFVKNGIFGWLVQGARSGGVEESDRIGVLLCNVKPALQEERRFCFEIKTKDTTIVLQAETQKELLEWIESFEAAKRKSVEDTTGGDSPTSVHAREAAFAINPPSAPEFAVKSADSHGADDAVAAFDRSATLPVPDRDSGGHLLNRSTFDVSGRRSIGAEREGEGSRDHAARIIQKLDLHRKSNAGSQVSSSPVAGPPSAGLGGGIASLISASHNILPVHSGPTATPAGSADTQPSSRSDVTLGTLATSSNTVQLTRDVPPSTLAPSTLANPPAPTNLSKTAVVVSGERGIGQGRTDASGGVPSGIMANLWGSSNWGYLNRLERGEVKQTQQESRDTDSVSTDRRRLTTESRKDVEGAVIEAPELIQPPPTSSPSPSPPSSRHRRTISLDADASRMQTSATAAEAFPWNYPVQLRTQHAQFRMLFPDARRDDHVLLVFRATWNPNDQQEFPGRVYVTAKDVYFYSHHLGLVLTSGVSLGSIDEVTAAPGKECDYIFLHLKEGRAEAGYTRITIKTFLEPLRLLQRRLNLLIRNQESSEPLGLEALLNELIKMEKDDGGPSPSMESWEDVSINTPVDEGSSSLRTGPGRRDRDLRAPLRIDGGLFDVPRRGAEPREVTKFMLPPDPVIYEPRDMMRTAVEQNFEISAKALYHVLFGDKSAVFQLMYHERHAQGIKQRPWRKIGDSSMRREFDYHVDYLDQFGRSRQNCVRDTQVIETINDHLCYVIADEKTPWYLPHHQDFRLLTKIVITHVAKSRCKLAIYTSLMWSRQPLTFRGMIESQALHDLDIEARDLADVVTDQVRRLGPRSRTAKAIQIFGHVGHHSDTTMSPSINPGDGVTIQLLPSTLGKPRRPPRRRRTLTHLLLESLYSVTESIVSQFMIALFGFVRKLYKISSAHVFILALLGLSVLGNLLGSSRGVGQWWSERAAARFMGRLGVGPDLSMGRQVWLSDVLDDLGSTNGTTTAGLEDNACYATFRSLISATSPPPSSASASGHVATKMHRRTLSRLANQRHDILVALRVINTIEREVSRAAWESWAMAEVGKCQGLKQLVGSEDGGPKDGGANQVTMGHKRDPEKIREWLEGYCGSCQSAVESRRR